MQSNFSFSNQFEYLTGSVVDLRLISTQDGNDKELPYYWFEIIDKNTKTVVGKVSIRIGHNYHSYYNGNVGYEIDEPFRGHHFAYFATKMVFEVAKFHKMTKLLIACDFDNVASIRTIESLGGELVEEVLPPKDYVYYHSNIRPQKIYQIGLLRKD